MKKLFKLGFMSLILSSLIVMTGCYKDDINNLEEDVNELRKDLADEVLAFRGEIQRVDGLITVLDNAITKLETDMNLGNPNSALSLAIAAGDLATLNSAKAYAEQLRDALQLQINPVKNFLVLNASGKFVVNEAAPNDMLNGEYATLGQFVTAMTAHLSSLKGLIQQNTEDIAALTITVNANSAAIDRIDGEILNIYGLLGDLEAVLGADGNIADALDEIFDRIDGIDASIATILDDIIPGLEQDIADINTAIGTMGAFWGDFTGSTVWEAIGHNFAKTQAIYNRLDNLNGDPRTLESFVEDVDQFILDTEAELTSIQERFAGFADGETIADFVADAILAKVGSLTSGGTTYLTVTAMVNGEIAKLKEELTDYIDGEINDLKTELQDYVNDKITALRNELLGVMQEMVTGIAIVSGNVLGTPPVSYDFNIGYDVIRELQNFTFGPAGQTITFTEGNIVLSAEPTPQPILVKITPDHVDLTNADLVLFDSEKRDYLEDGTFSYTIAPYAGGLLTRAVANTGLWVVTLKIEDVNGFPEGVLLSLGVENNMVAAAAPDRIVSTGPVIDASTAVADYDPVYYVEASNPVYIVSYKNIPAAINTISNSGPNQIWNPVPSVDRTLSSPTYGQLIPGTGVSDDDRSLTPPNIHYLTVISPPEFTVSLDGTYDALRAWYVEFKSQMPAATIESDWGGNLNMVRSIENSDINSNVQVMIPLNNALHREVVEFNVHGVNVDATLVDPDGVPFTVGIVAPDVEADALEVFTVQLDEDYAPGDWNKLFTTDAIPFNISDFGFTPAFNGGLTATYEIELADPAYIIGGVSTNPHFGLQIPAALPTVVNANNQLLGVMQTTVDGSNWYQVNSATNWNTVTAIRFTGVDPKAFEQGAIYEGTLVLTEDPAKTIVGLTNPTNPLLHVDGSESAAISITIPISITLGGEMPFDLTMMNYKPNMGAGNNLIVWPIATSLPAATHNFDSSFDYFTPTVPANVVFTTTETGLSVTDHDVTIADIVSKLSSPSSPIKNTFTAYYTYGPVWENMYGDGNYMALWENNNNGNFTVEFRNRMDWVTYDDANLNIGLATLVATPGTAFVFRPAPNSGLGTSENTFTLANAFANGWVTSATAKIFQGINEVNYVNITVDNTGTLTYVTGSSSLNPGDSVTLNLVITVIDQFNQTHEYTHTMTING